MGEIKGESENRPEILSLDLTNYSTENTAPTIVNLLDSKGVELPENRDLLGLGARFAVAEQDFAELWGSKKITLVDRHPVVHRYLRREDAQIVIQDMFEFLEGKVDRQYGFIICLGVEYSLEAMKISFDNFLQKIDKWLVPRGLLILEPTAWDWLYREDIETMRKRGYVDRGGRLSHGSYFLQKLGSPSK